jgi:hypothetical protein
MFDLFALLTLLASMLAPIGESFDVGAGSSYSGDSGTVMASGDGTPEPPVPGRR